MVGRLSTHDHIVRRLTGHALQWARLFTPFSLLLRMSPGSAATWSLAVMELCWRLVTRLSLDSLDSHFVEGESVFLYPVLSVRVMSCVNES